MKIYKSAVCCLLTYGCEAWTLDDETTAMLNGANARCLSRFTGGKQDSARRGQCSHSTLRLGVDHTTQAI